jgi:hypothetical protein
MMKGLGVRVVWAPYRDSLGKATMSTTLMILGRGPDPLVYFNKMCDVRTFANHKAARGHSNDSKPHHLKPAPRPDA